MSIVKLNNRGVRSATTFGSISNLGSMVLIKKVTASSSSTVSFVDGTSDVVLDNTYKEYLFTFNNIHPSATSYFQFNASIDTGSNYNVTKTTTAFYAQHKEDDETGFAYSTGADLAQGTGVQKLITGELNSGNAKVLGWFVGQVMKETKGQANPSLVNKVIVEKLKN